jgi:hypothetical protein
MAFLSSMARTPRDEVVEDLEGFLKELEGVIQETMKWWASLGLSETRVKKHVVGAWWTRSECTAVSWST